MPGALTTDLYQLTMAAAYHAHGMNYRAAFELFVRRLPENRGFLVAAGLEPALDYLERLRFDDGDLGYLRGLPVFQGVDLAFLRDLRFTGDVDAMPEGTVAFAHEPILRVTGPVIEAQLVETCLLATINFQTLIATKAARCVSAAAGRSVFDFGLRRAHGSDAGFAAARAAFIAGATGTSNVEAGRALGLPVTGTMAHSWVMAHDDEREAFGRYTATFPGHSVLLIDTYDTVEGARRAAQIPGIKAVRLDSGDLLDLSKRVRTILDEAGRGDVKIVASGDLNEYKIGALLAGGAPIDVFGVGTEMVTSRDAPALGGVYKLVEQQDVGGQWVGKAKFSAEKATYPGRKQVYRREAQGRYVGDSIVAADEAPEGTPLLVPVMRDGRRVRPAPPLAELQSRAREQVGRLPEGVRKFTNPEPYPVTFSARLEGARKRP